MPAAHLYTQVPNALTLLRGIIAACIAMLLLSSYESRFIAAYVLFVIAAASDYWDGVLARRWRITSDMGAILDPLFDKILVLSLFVLLAPHNIVHPLLFVILLVRDISTDALRNYLLSKGVVVAAIYTAKLKTVAQMAMLHFVLLALALPEIPAFVSIAQVLAVIAVALSLWSGAAYVSRFMAFMKKDAMSSTK